MLIESVDDMLHFGVLLSIAVRWAVSRFPYSGAGKPPLYGDYEAQRHWMEITVNLPIHEWYQNSTSNDLMYWGLDYPPLTAYHSMLCGYVASWINPEWIELFSSRGFESYYHKIFMRSSVLVSDIIFYLAIIIYWSGLPRPSKLRDKAIGTSLCLLYPGLILIDHGHFQYNSVCLGLTVGAVVCLFKGQDLIGALIFTLALHYKQMALYYAFPFFCYLLGTCFRLPWHLGASKFLLLGLVVISTSLVCWMPFLRSSESAFQVVHRLFPLARGIFEDKVANVWYVLSIFIKFKQMISTSSLAILSAICTLLFITPSSIQLLRNPNLYQFRLALVHIYGPLMNHSDTLISHTLLDCDLTGQVLDVNSSLAFFLFSYQVHEKSILFPSVAVLLLVEDHPLACIWFSCISTYSLVPLLAKDGLIIPFAALTSLFIIGAVRGYENMLLSFRTRFHAITSILFCVSLIGGLILTACMYTVQQPARYPHLHVLLNCVYSAVHFTGFAIYFNILQFKDETLPSVSSKQKRL